MTTAKDARTSAEALVSSDPKARDARTSVESLVPTLVKAKDARTSAEALVPTLVRGKSTRSSAEVLWSANVIQRSARASVEVLVEADYPLPNDPKFDTFTESFDEDELSPDKWTTVGDQFILDAGRLEFDTDFVQVSTVGTFDLTDSSVYCEITTTYSAQVDFQIFQDDILLRFSISTYGVDSEHTLYMLCYDGTENPHVTYDKVAHKWLRIGQDSAGHTSFSASPDGVTWTTLFTSSRAFPVTHGILQYQTGAP